MVGALVSIMRALSANPQLHTWSGKRAQNTHSAGSPEGECAAPVSQASLQETPVLVFSEHDSVGKLWARGVLACRAGGHLYPAAQVSEKSVCQHPGELLPAKAEITSFQAHTAEQNSEGRAAS